jgi:hypothetical protein
MRRSQSANELVNEICSNDRIVVAISSAPPKPIPKEFIEKFIQECGDELDNSFSAESENEYIDKELKMSCSADSENEYATDSDYESDKENSKDWVMSYSNIIFFILGYIQKNEIDFGDKQQSFIQYCYYKMRGDICKGDDTLLKNYPSNYVGIVDKKDYSPFWTIYKQIDGAWDTFCLHTYYNKIDIPLNFNYSSVFYDEKYGVINPK